MDVITDQDIQELQLTVAGVREAAGDTAGAARMRQAASLREGPSLDEEREASRLAGYADGYENGYDMGYDHGYENAQDEHARKRKGRNQ